MTTEINPSKLEYIVASGSQIDTARELINKYLYRPHDMEEITERFDEGTVYVVAVYNDLVIGSGRICPNAPKEKIEESSLWDVINREIYDGKVAMFRGIAVEEEFQRKGIGEQLRRISQELALDAGKYVMLALRRRSTAKKLYEKLGFTYLKEEENPDPVILEKIGPRDWVYKIIEPLQ